MAALLLKPFREYNTGGRIGFFILNDASSNDICVDLVLGKSVVTSRPLRRSGGNRPLQARLGDYKIYSDDNPLATQLYLEFLMRVARDETDDSRDLIQTSAINRGRGKSALAHSLECP
jgi:hypothetical protein